MYYCDGLTKKFVLYNYEGNDSSVIHKFTLANCGCVQTFSRNKNNLVDRILRVLLICSYVHEALDDIITRNYFQVLVEF